MPSRPADVSDSTRTVTTVWITNGGDRLHVDRDCTALKEGQDAARLLGYTVHPPVCTPVNLASRTTGFLTARRAPCSVCWTPGLERATEDSDEVLAAYAAAPAIAAAEKDAASKLALAAKAAAALRLRFDLTPVQEGVARQLIRLHWFEDRDPAVRKLTDEEIALAAKGE